MIVIKGIVGVFAAIGILAVSRVIYGIALLWWGDR